MCTWYPALDVKDLVVAVSCQDYANPLSTPPATDATAIDIQSRGTNRLIWHMEAAVFG